ncbi:MAG: hypothetical protein ABI629_18000 [bacterium]
MTLAALTAGARGVASPVDAQSCGLTRPANLTVSDDPNQCAPALGATVLAVPIALLGACSAYAGWRRAACVRRR